jgi:adenosylcobyric acid synthase
VSASVVPPAGPHGDDVVRVAHALGRDPASLLDLATTLNPFAPDVAGLVARHAGVVARYPDETGARHALAEAIGVSPDEVLLTNGGAEAIALVAALRREGFVEEPEFSLYRRHLEALAPDAGRWRSNPHSPTGRLARPEERAAVWDEAFYALSTGAWTRGDHRRGALVVGSLTKLFACPGLRMGYVLGPPEEIDRLEHRRPRWSLGGLAAEVLPDLLAWADLPALARAVAEARAALASMLRSRGLEVESADAPWVLARGVPDLRDRLALEGVLVRDCSSFGLPGTFRLAVPAPDGLGRLEDALDRALSPRTPRSSSGRAAGARAAGVRATRPGRGRARSWRGAVMVCATASDAGKSQLVAGICRMLARQGVRVAPFKGQNMSLNAAATPSGHEIGRAQALQAAACGVEPEVAMNPVLLKPTGERTSQVVVMGRPVGELDAQGFQAAKPGLRPVVLDALADLRRRFDVVVLEGAGGAAEINLLEGDLVNLGLAEAAGVPALLVGDIERGGVFASLYGTVALLPGPLRSVLRGLVVNKLRGDPSLLAPGLVELERRCGLPVLGVIPYVEGLGIDAEDSLSLGRLPPPVARRGPGSDAEGAVPGGGAAGTSSRSWAGDGLDVAVVALPRIANFTDVDPLALEPGVGVRFVRDPAGLGDPDLVVLPGSKTTVADLRWLRESGMAAALEAAVRRVAGPVLLGVCAGFQMLGRLLADDVESRAGEVAGLGLLPVETRFAPEKLTRRRRGRALGEPVEGYEIRHGRPVVSGPGARPWVLLEDACGTEEEGAWREDGRVVGTSLHGLFEADGFREAFLFEVARRRGKRFVPSGLCFAEAREAQLDRLADLVEAALDLDALEAVVSGAPLAGPLGRNKAATEALG